MQSMRLFLHVCLRRNIHIAALSITFSTLILGSTYTIWRSIPHEYMDLRPESLHAAQGFAAGQSFLAQPAYGHSLTEMRAL